MSMTHKRKQPFSGPTFSTAFSSGNTRRWVTVLTIIGTILLSQGCGIPATSSGQAQNGNSGTNPNGGQAVPIPTTTQSLTGCSNPNTGTSNGDWGVGTDPVFVNPWSVLVGQPVYTSNAIFWTSRETKPGQSILLTGAFTDATKHARLALIPPGTTDWESVVKQSTSLVSTSQQGTTGLSFIVPSSFPAGVYGFQIEDATASPVLGLANSPALNWAIGIPPTTDPSTALRHQVYDCGVEPGGTLRIFGKNFLLTNNVVLQTSTGVAYALTASKLDSNSISVPIPSSIAPGTYNLWVGTLPWSATSSPAAQITVHSPPAFTVRKVTCSTLVGDGVTDNTALFQSCLDSYAPSPGSQEVAYIAIPAGNFVLTAGVTAHSGEVLVGVSSAATNFLGKPAKSAPSQWFTVPQYFGMANLSFQAPASLQLLLSSGVVLGLPSNSGHLYFDNVSFASTAGAFNPNEQMFLVAGPDVQVYDSSFLSNSNQDFDLNFGDGAIVSGNKFILNNWTGLGIEDSQNVIFEKNTTTSQNPLNQGQGGLSAGSGLSISRGNSQFGPSALSQDIYVGYNTFENMGSGSQQVITNDGDGGSYFGQVATSSSSTVTLAADPAWNWVGNTNPQAAVMSIIAGRGVGQYSFLKSFSGRTIDLIAPWKVTPDETSVVAITQYELHMTFANNTITNTLGASIVLADSLEGVIEDNSLANSGGGILISGFGPYGGPAAYGPVINTDVLRNTLSVGDGNYIFPDVEPNFIFGIGIQDFPGILMSGVLVRDNVVPSINRIYNTDGLNGVSANLIEQNQADWQPTFPTVGFLIQDNSPPPEQ